MINYGIYTEDLPELKVIQSGGIYQIMFNFESVEHASEEEEEADDQKHFKCELIEVKSLDYSSIVSAVIRGKYTQDDVEAILSNYQLCKDGEAGDKCSVYTQRYTEYQARRVLAKDVANEVMNKQ